MSPRQLVNLFCVQQLDRIQHIGYAKTVTTCNLVVVPLPIPTPSPCGAGEERISGAPAQAKPSPIAPIQSRSVDRSV